MLEFETRELARLRDERLSLLQELARRRDAFDAENRVLIQQLTEATQAANEAEAALRAAAVAAWKPGDKKRLNPGVEIAVREKVFLNESAAMTWAEHNAPFLIRRSLDEKTVKDLIKNGALPPSVGDVRDVVDVRLATDLAAAFGEAAEDG